MIEVKSNTTVKFVECNRKAMEMRTKFDCAKQKAKVKLPIVATRVSRDSSARIHEALIRTRTTCLLMYLSLSKIGDSLSARVSIHCGIFVVARIF